MARKKKEDLFEEPMQPDETAAVAEPVESEIAPADPEQDSTEPAKPAEATETAESEQEFQLPYVSDEEVASSALQLEEPAAAEPESDSGPEPTIADSPPPPEPAKGLMTIPRSKNIMDLDLNALDRDLSAEQRQEWQSIYASFRAKSILSGTIIGVDQNFFNTLDGNGMMVRKRLFSMIVVNYRVKVLIPATELWFPGEERPEYVLKNMVGSKIDYVIMGVDREGECAIASRRLALAERRRYFGRIPHRGEELLTCRVQVVGAKRCLVECQGYDITLTQRELSYTSIPDLRAKYHPGQELKCVLKGIYKDTGRPNISVKEVNPNPFDGADLRHPRNSRRQAIISGKYAGGVFCTLPDETVCLCLYSPLHSDADFKIGDTVIITISRFDFDRKLVYGKILSKW